MILKNPGTAVCARCRQQVDTDLFQDAWGNRARLMVAHGSCSYSFKPVRFKPGDRDSPDFNFAEGLNGMGQDD